MTRLVCIGDCHFGAQGGRNEDRRSSFDQIIIHGARFAAEGTLGAWLLAGDLNHAKMTIDDRNWLADRLSTMANLAPALILRGNHDAEADEEIFTHLRGRWPIQVIASARTVFLPLATRRADGIQEQALVLCVPYVFKSGLVSVGVDHDQLAQTARDLLDPVFIAANDELREAVDGGARPVMLIHMNIGGAISSSAQPQIGREIELDAALLARIDPTVPKICGHIHKHQHIHGAVYLGSVAPLDFGETEEKVFGVLSFETPTSWTLDFPRLDVPKQLHIEGRLTREGFIPDDPFLPDVTGALVRCRYTYVKSEVGSLDIQQIKDVFTGARSLKLEPVPILAHTIRQPEIAAAVTLDEKVAVYAKTHGITVTVGLTAKLTALQSLTPEAILSQVTEQAKQAGAKS